MSPLWVSYLNLSYIKCDHHSLGPKEGLGMVFNLLSPEPIYMLLFVNLPFLLTLCDDAWLQTAVWGLQLSGAGW